MQNSAFDNSNNQLCNGATRNYELRRLDDLHIIEAIFKSFAKALDEAVGYDPRITDVLSTKGTL